jgi:hypothetical protein
MCEGSGSLHSGNTRDLNVDGHQAPSTLQASNIIKASATLEGASDYYEGRTWLNPKSSVLSPQEDHLQAHMCPKLIGSLKHLYTPTELSFFVGTPLHRDRSAVIH